MKLVILESPYAGAFSLGDGKRYARECVADSLKRGEAPLASHLLYTQPGILDDDVPEERALGIAAGHAWYRHANVCVVYEDMGVSKGMQEGIDRARSLNVPIERRSLRDATDKS